MDTYQFLVRSCLDPGQVQGICAGIIPSFLPFLIFIARHGAPGACGMLLTCLCHACQLVLCRQRVLMTMAVDTPFDLR